MRALPSIVFYDVIQDPRYPENEARWLEHLTCIFP